MIIMDSLVQRARRGQVLRPIIKEQVQQQIAAIIKPMSNEMVMRFVAVPKQTLTAEYLHFANIYCSITGYHNGHS